MSAYPGTTVDVETSVIVRAYYSDTGFLVDALKFNTSGPDEYCEESLGDGMVFGTPYAEPYQVTNIVSMAIIDGNLKLILFKFFWVGW